MRVQTETKLKPTAAQHLTKHVNERTESRRYQKEHGAAESARSARIWDEYLTGQQEVLEILKACRWSHSRAESIIDERERKHVAKIKARVYKTEHGKENEQTRIEGAQKILNMLRIYRQENAKK